MITPKYKRNINRIFPFGLIWLVFSLIYTILERGLLGDLNFYPSSGLKYIFGRNIIIIPVLATLFGTIIGILEILYFNKWFIQISFTKKIIYKSFVYLLIISFLLIIIFLTATSEATNAISSKEFWIVMFSYFTDYSFLGILTYIASIILMTQFYTEVSESMGTGLLSNFFLGKYNKPVEEERIFMFLDMKSSTRIAEKLGHVVYFQMLQQYFSDLSGPVIDYSGEIYQYAGDEMIISWRLEKGLRNNTCIRCFFAMKESLMDKSFSYKEKYGLVPQFKAGLHCGKVTTGEIGVLKKEIIFTGDVLNTTARIEGLCNQYDVDILVSDSLAQKLDLSPYYEVESVGKNTLRGKDGQFELFTVN
ncbi:adenylate/guanylate cyclase domain-containing protein [Flavobacterium sp. CLA17]|uniref:adenylate/guanylate cyclase domain-containing protein n=1 Tax=Flavobacterium sp. CLA17 TaxID=2724135 RepID=UPI0014913003|nr:adenylate/guanylate cyclase domain-containing protein [Flavobacterium sp. CLA17]QSB26334.1 adenylate/guanylate cyclase domain-containing protein [Flavobacterium sp. CLA17]